MKRILTQQESQFVYVCAYLSQGEFEAALLLVKREKLAQHTEIMYNKKPWMI